MIEREGRDVSHAGDLLVLRVMGSEIILLFFLTVLIAKSGPVVLCFRLIMSFTEVCTSLA